MIAANALGTHVPDMSKKLDSIFPEDLRAAMANEAVGHRLNLLRRAYELKPSEMADSLGIERTYWTRYEKGRQGLSDNVAALLTVKFRVTTDFLLLGKWDNLPFDLAEKMRALPPE